MSELMASLDDHQDCLRLVLSRLQEAGLQVNAPKLKFCAIETEYLGYILTRTGIKPQPNKVQVIFAITPPKPVKDLHRFLGMVQDYREIWARHSEIFAPLTSLESVHTNATKAKKTKMRPWYWDENTKYAHASSKPLGSIITKGNRPLAFFSRKLSVTQQKYSMTEIELLAIVETLKEFKCMLW
eukprot:CCRYP_016448-RA/>CCRYP_016448-RA protein AED:0.42 eAED:0.40 QI:0/0/0/0.5/0/0/4/0/183